MGRIGGDVIVAVIYGSRIADLGGFIRTEIHNWFHW
jgi:hypothetical protein